MRSWDAIVIGAGPAGAIAARTLAVRGARVALVDGSHPREKPCGGGLTSRALEAAGLLSFDEGRAIDSVRFSHVEVSRRDTSRSVAVGLENLSTLRIFPRETLDRELFDTAVAAGATHIPARATGLSREGGDWLVHSHGERLRSRWIVGADGASSFVRKRVFRPFDRDQLSIAAGSYVDGVESSEVFIGFTDAPRGYLWSFPRPGHLAVGACAQANETSTRELHAVCDAWLDGCAGASGKPRRRYAWPIPSLDSHAIDREEPAGAGWMLTGDAAGLVDPITREGIYFAVRSGQLAADALSTRDPARAYAEAVRDELHAELRRAARLKAGFFRPRFTRLLVDALADSRAIREVMVDLVAGRQPYAGLKRRLLGTFELGLMLRLLISPCNRRARAR